MHNNHIAAFLHTKIEAMIANEENVGTNFGIVPKKN